MSFDFELLLVLLTIFTGLIALASYFILNFNYNQCKIIIYNKKKLKAGYKLSLQLGIDNNHIIKDYKNSVWDLALIIRKDYNTLNSFEIINKSHEPF